MLDPNQDAATSPHRDQSVQSPGGYRYSSSAHSPSHAYLLPAIEAILDGLRLPAENRRIFELGCGNGSVAAHLAKKGFQVVGVDASEEGIRVANASHPDLRLEQGSAYDDLRSRFGPFPVVLSLEVVEHLYFPRQFAARVRDLLEEGGKAIISTPFHGYWKNLAMALSGRMDAHFTALWDYGHIKFWSEKTLTQLLEEAGLRVEGFRRVGRIPALAKSMIAIARK